MLEMCREFQKDAYILDAGVPRLLAFAHRIEQEAFDAAAHICHQQAQRWVQASDADRACLDCAIDIRELAKERAKQ